MKPMLFEQWKLVLLRYISGFSQKLKLNPEKTEFMIIGTRQQLKKVNIDCVQVGDRQIMPSSVAKNLGSWFDSKLNMSAY
jgi:hypothetical protein